MTIDVLDATAGTALNSQSVSSFRRRQVPGLGHVRDYVRYGTSPSSLTQSLRVQGANVTSATISGLAAGTYYFAVATVNSAGVAGAPTKVVSKAVP